jgi:hypothetical protein
MLPNVALAVATLGLLLIMVLVYREVGAELKPFDKTSFGGGALVILLVAIVHIAATAGGGAH